MAVQVFKFAHTTELFVAHGLNWLSDNFSLHLLDSGYSFNDAHTEFAQLSGNEVVDGSYSSEQLANKSSTVEGLFADPVVFTSLNATFRYGVLVANGVFDSKTDPPLVLILFDDTPADISVPAVDYTVPWNTNGVFSLVDD